MKTLLKLVSYSGLALSIIPPLLFWAGKLSMQANLRLLVAGMFLWFGTAIFWIRHEKTEA